MAPVVRAAGPGISVEYESPITNARHPNLVYWFWKADTLANKQYLRDIQDMADNGPFDMAFLTDRGADFYDFPKTHDAIADAVRHAHALNLRIGLQLWAENYPPVAAKDALALVVEGEVTLDANGRADYRATTTRSRSHDPIQSGLLKAYAFRKTGGFFYDPASLADVTNRVKTVSSTASSVSLAIDGGPALAGDTVYVLTVHYHNFPDLFGTKMEEHFLNTLNRYRDIPFDGTALDEYGYMSVNPIPTPPFRDRIYGDHFAAEFERQTGKSLPKTLFDMRYAPAGRPDVTASAINQYFDVLRQGPLRGEHYFYRQSKRIFGANTFAGIHNTYHNHLTNDEVWRTGINWWTNPREYGQSDEDLLLPLRMGLLVSHAEPVMYDQYYGHDLHRFLSKAIVDARWGARIHYHAWNDTGRWGINMADPTARKAISTVETKIRLLNRFDPAAPRLPLLVIFGMPAQLNWYPNSHDRSNWDLNGSLGIEDKVSSVWNAGYATAVVPSDLVDNGQLTLGRGNRPTINGHSFDAVIYLYPQYAKPSTLKFLESYVASGGKLMLEGDATSDFGGNDIAARFNALAAKATVRGFDVSRIKELGIATNAYPYGAFMEDGAVILTDLPSIETSQPKPFSVLLSGHTYTGAFTGVFALKANAAGHIEKLACGQLSALSRDGKVILALAHPADAVLVTDSRGSARVLLEGRPGDNAVTYAPGP
jgi:hypothetical protein